MLMQEQRSDILNPLSKDEQIAYLKDLNTALALKNTILIKENDALIKDNTELSKDLVSTKRDYDLIKEKYDGLIEQIKILNARYFGAKADRIQPYQLSLFNDMEATSDPLVPEPDYKEALPKKRKKKSSIDYSKFETSVIEYELSESDRHCDECDSVMNEMGIEVKHTLKLIPARLVCEEHRRHVYVCRQCSARNAKDGETEVKIVKASMPKLPLEKSCATPSLLAHILYQKYSLAQPLYRIADDMRRSVGLTLSRQTLANWVIRSHTRWLATIYALMKKRILENDILMVDETPVQVLKEPDRTPAQKSYMWVFASAACDVPCYIFEYHDTRARSVVADFLKGWSGTIVTDGYKAYDNVGDDITKVSCIIHIRRKFTEIIKGLGTQKLDAMPGILSNTAVRMLGEIIATDNGFDDMKPDERKIARLVKLKPKMDAFFEWCLEKRTEAMPSMALSRAFNNAIAQWPYLRNALKDGRLPLDSNRAEQSIRPFAIGRKNWLFSDTPEGAHASAAIYSIITTAKANGLKPREYLTWLFEEMPNTDNLGDEAVLARFLPWSDVIPQSCRVSAAEAASAVDPLDEPILDIDPSTLDED